MAAMRKRRPSCSFTARASLFASARKWRVCGFQNCSPTSTETIMDFGEVPEMGRDRIGWDGLGGGVRWRREVGWGERQRDLGEG